MKNLTIDEILIKNGITHLTGKEHDGIIVAFNQYLQQETKPLEQEITDLQTEIRNLTFKGIIR
jgi:hypothetical protein